MQSNFKNLIVKTVSKKVAVLPWKSSSSSTWAPPLTKKIILSMLSKNLKEYDYREMRRDPLSPASSKLLKCRSSYEIDPRLMIMYTIKNSDSFLFTVSVLLKKDQEKVKILSI